MPASPHTSLDLASLSTGQFDIASLDDEMRVDALCVEMIRGFFATMTQQTDLDPADVGRVCHGIDYFLREFVIAECRDNLLQLDASHVRRFAGHWYIVKNLEPNMGELALILDGIAAFYRFLEGVNLIETEQLDHIQTSCAERGFYQQRIEDFWAIESDGFLAWRDEVPL